MHTRLVGEWRRADSSCGAQAATQTAAVLRREAGDSRFVFLAVRVGENKFAAIRQGRFSFRLGARDFRPELQRVIGCATAVSKIEQHPLYAAVGPSARHRRLQRHRRAFRVEQPDVACRAERPLWERHAAGHRPVAKFVREFCRGFNTQRYATALRGPRPGEWLPRQIAPTGGDVASVARYRRNAIACRIAGFYAGQRHTMILHRQRLDDLLAITALDGA